MEPVPRGRVLRSTNPRKRATRNPKSIEAMLRAQRSFHAHQQHPQRSTRQVAARHRSADLPGQADGSHKPRAAYAALTPHNAYWPYWPYLKHPTLLTQRKLRHRSTRTLNPLAGSAAAPRKPNLHPPPMPQNKKMADTHRISHHYLKY